MEWLATWPVAFLIVGLSIAISSIVNAALEKRNKMTDNSQEEWTLIFADAIRIANSEFHKQLQEQKSKAGQLPHDPRHCTE